MDKKNRIHVGFIEQFKWADTLLFVGDGPSFMRMASLLEDANADELAKLLVCHGVHLNVVIPAAETAVTKDGAAVVWAISPEHVEKYIGQIRALADSGGHHYLEAPSGIDIDVMVSQGEYSPDIFADAH